MSCSSSQKKTCLSFSFCCLLVQVLPSTNNKLSFTPDDDESVPISNDFLSNVVQHTHQLSNKPLIYISHHNSKHASTTLINSLHKKSFQTVIGYEPAMRSHQESKNILFLVTECSDILNVILSSVAEKRFGNIASTTSNETQIQRKNGNAIGSSLPNYCIDYIETKQRAQRLGKLGVSCDYLLEIAETDLEAGFVMSDSLFDQTSGLFHHPVWNAKNYLIFAVSGPEIAPNRPKVDIYNNDSIHTNRVIHKNCHLPFIFKFMWRMFRGFRSVICFEEECIKYDPFRGSLITHTRESDTYFDFPLVPPQGQNYLINLYNNENPFDEYFGLKNWREAASFTLLAIAKNLGGDIKFEIDTRAENDTLDPENYNMALKTDADLVIFEGSLTDKDFRNIEVIPLFEPGQIRFVVPDLGFLPSYLAPARCFSLLVWFFIFFSFSVFAIFHEVYRRTRIATKARDTEIAESISTIFTIYSYIICVSQTKLLLSSATGKIFFIVCSFPCVILSSVFLSLMVTFFMEQVRFTPLDTAEELRESDFLFQAVNTTDDKSHLIFTEDPRYEWLKNRSIDSMYTLWRELRAYGTMVGYDEIFDEVYQLGEMNVSDFTVKEIYQSLREMLYRDGFILFFPDAAGHKDLMTVEDPQIVNRSHYYHIVREPIMSWPFDMRVLSSSVYYELFKSIVMRLTEGGILTKWFERFTDPTWYDHFIQFEDEKGQPRAFSMKDLRLGFICLVLGSLFSSFVFMAEILVDNPDGCLNFEY